MGRGGGGGGTSIFACAQHDNMDANTACIPHFYTAGLHLSERGNHMNGALVLNKEDGVSGFPHGGLASPPPVLCDFIPHPGTIRAAAVLLCCRFPFG